MGRKENNHLILSNEVIRKKMNELRELHPEMDDAQLNILATKLLQKEFNHTVDRAGGSAIRTHIHGKGRKK